MPLITTKGIYGLSAIYELSKYDRSIAVQIKTIAQSTNISANYLEQLFSVLKKNGFIKSVRGAKGGYMLCKKPSEIKILDILRSLEGGLSFAEYDLENGVLKIFFQNMQQKMEDMLDIPLSEFKNYEATLNNSFIYNI